MLKLNRISRVFFSFSFLEGGELFAFKGFLISRNAFDKVSVNNPLDKIVHIC